MFTRHDLKLRSTFSLHLKNTCDFLTNNYTTFLNMELQKSLVVVETLQNDYSRSHYNNK